MYDAHLSTRGQQVYEVDEVLELLRLLALHQHLLAVFLRLVKDIGQLLVVLHDVFHHIRLVALEGQTWPLHLHDDIEQVKELWRLLLVPGDQVNDALDLLGQDLEASDLVTPERLAGQDDSEYSHFYKT